MAWSVLPTLTKRPTSYSFWVPCMIIWLILSWFLELSTNTNHHVIHTGTSRKYPPGHHEDKRFRAEKQLLANYLKGVGYEAQFVLYFLLPPFHSCENHCKTFPLYVCNFLWSSVFYHCWFYLPIFYSEYQSPSDAAMVTFPSSPISFKAFCLLVHQNQACQSSVKS